MRLWPKLAELLYTLQWTPLCNGLQALLEFLPDMAQQLSGGPMTQLGCSNWIICISLYISWRISEVSNNSHITQLGRYSFVRDCWQLSHGFFDCKNTYMLTITLKQISSKNAQTLLFLYITPIVEQFHERYGDTLCNVHPSSTGSCSISPHLLDSLLYPLCWIRHLPRDNAC